MNNKANIILTHNCNLRCLHCYIDAKACKEDLEKNYNKTIELIDKLEKDNFKQIMFTGGECLIFPKIVDLIKYAKSKNMIVSIFTNGMIFNQEVLDLVDMVNISVDGPDNIHNYIRQNENSYNNILKVLDYLKTIDKYTTLQMTINNFNYDNLDYLVDLTLSHLNVRTVKIACVINDGRAKENSIYLDKEMLEKVYNKMDSLYEKTKYHIQFVTSLYNKYDFENYCLNEKMMFPIWFDIPNEKYYLLNDKLSTNYDLNEYEFKNIEKDNLLYKKILKENKETIEKEDYIDIEKSLFELIGGNKNEE